MHWSSGERWRQSEERVQILVSGILHLSLTFMASAQQYSSPLLLRLFPEKYKRPSPPWKAAHSSFNSSSAVPLLTFLLFLFLLCLPIPPQSPPSPQPSCPLPPPPPVYSPCSPPSIAHFQHTTTHLPSSENVSKTSEIPIFSAAHCPTYTLHCPLHCLLAAAHICEPLNKPLHIFFHD